MQLKGRTDQIGARSMKFEKRYPGSRFPYEITTFFGRQRVSLSQTGLLRTKRSV